MRELFTYWLIIVIAPGVFWLSSYVFGMAGLAVFLAYYSPLFFLGEPFFTHSSDIGWFPSITGVVSTVVIYSVIYWVCYGMFQLVVSLFFKGLDGVVKDATKDH